MPRLLLKSDLIPQLVPVAGNERQAPYIAIRHVKPPRKPAPKRTPPPDLFDAGGDARRDQLEALKKRVVRFASGLSRTNDFVAAARAGHGVGVEIGELSEPAMAELARCIVDYQVPTFIDSGAFGVFMRGLKHQNVEGGDVQGLDFDAILSRYDDLLDAISDHNDAEEDHPKPYLVMPDVVGDQLASIDLITKYRNDIRIYALWNVCQPIIPIQRGPLTMADAYARLVDVLGTDDFVVGIPSNAAAISPEEFTAFLAEAKPKAVHILGALHDTRLTPRLNQILDSGIADQVEVSADANPLRSMIVERGQTAEERRARITDRLSERARLDELAAYIRRAGGLEALQEQFRTGSADNRRRTLGLFMDLSGLQLDEVRQKYGLSNRS